MVITLYQYTGKTNVINKVLQNGVNVDGTIKDITNVITPQIRFRAKPTLQDIQTFNYCYISALNRYYFVENAEIISSDVICLNLRVDVLKSNENALLQSTATVTECENANKYISNRNNIHDVRPQFEKINFSVNAPFDENGNIIMITLKGN